LGSSNSASPIAYRGKDRSDQILAYYHELGFDALVVIGGDGTLSPAYEMSKLGMNIVGVPKTIDNDLMCTDRTFGFDTAISIVTDALDRLSTTGQSHKRVMIIETMGRYSGWIALNSGIAGGADVILIPEYPYDIEDVAKACKLRASDQQYSIIVVAEDAMPIDGHIQRGGSPTAFDRIFSSNVGREAWSLVAAKHFGRVVVMKDNHLSHVTLKQVANKIKMVPLMTCR
jgi:6-phosphofructokinase